jgi:Uma2 family endonuclease
MTQTGSKILTVNEFIDQYGDDSRYELIDGELIDMEPTGLHEQVAAFVGRKLNVEIDREDRPYMIPYRCLIKLLGTDTAFRPDVIILDQTRLVNEPLWQREPVITSGAPIKLIVEVVSANWSTDYARKVEDYAILGIPEYWIVDYLGLGGRNYIGYPKQPTVSIYLLSEGGDSYLPSSQFRGSDPIISATFPDLKLTAAQVFASANR